MARKGGNNPKREPVGDVAARLALPGRPSSRSPRPSQLTPTGLPGTGQPWRSTVGGDGNGRCPACDGSGWVERRDEYQGLPHVTMVPCPDPAGVHRAAEVARLARISGLLPEELALRLDDVVGRGGDTSKMVALARRFVEEPWGFLTLWGGYGNGKTLILQAVVNEFRERHGIVGTYVRMHDLIEYVRAGYAADARDDARARYERLKALPVLAIDEFEAARMTDFAYEFRTAFLDDRYRLAVARRAHTLFAMNCNPTQLPGDLYDRLRDGRFVIFHNADPSMRPAMKW